jgi:hypothetical protein
MRGVGNIRGRRERRGTSRREVGREAYQPGWAGKDEGGTREEGSS